MAPNPDEEQGYTVPSNQTENDPLLGENNRSIDSPKKDHSISLGNGIKDISLKRYYGLAYMLAMGMCGVVLVALGSTLQELAENAGRVSTDVGSVFIARGFGAICGAVTSAKLYQSINGNIVILWTILGMCAILLYLPFISTVISLHIAFMILGVSTAVTDTGCQIMTRRIHGTGAGPWLGANTVAFGLSGALVPCISYATSLLIVQYAIMSAIGIFAASSFIILPNPEKLEGYINKKPNKKSEGKNYAHNLLEFVHNYRIEFCVGFMVFWLIGGKVGATAYLTQYVSDTDIISESQSAGLIAVLWMAITVGRLFGIHIQRNIILSRLFFLTGIAFLGGAVGAFLPLILKTSILALWLSVAIYGFLNGPTVGFCYDLNNRTTMPCETGMSIVMFGLNCGASFIPFAISGIWDKFHTPSILFIVMVASHLLPYPAMLIMKSFHASQIKGKNSH